MKLKSVLWAMAGAVVLSQGTEGAGCDTDIDISFSDTEEKRTVIWDEREERKKDISPIINTYAPMHGGLGARESSFSALEGTFYDLKRYRDGKDTGLTGGFMGTDRVIEALARVFRADAWDAAELNKYYQADTRLYADYWYLPAARADYAPIEFGVGKAGQPVSQWECKPSAWVAVYRGKVIAPVTGKFRFIGTGDEFVAVRFGGKTVLDAGYCLPTLRDPKNPKACRIYGSDGQQWRDNIKSGKDKQRKNYAFITGIPGCEIWDYELGGLVAGNHFDVAEGEAYDIEIAIAEIPGGSFGFVLFIEALDDTGKPLYTARDKKYDLFRTSANNPDPALQKEKLEEAGCHVRDGNIPFIEESYIWEVRKD
ncbi:MAG: hypothetical protein E7033_03970 [Akkermansiaceae bacterium]|nr:hypothetical protein [Akkermansiaceae bacterium]